MVEIRLHFVQVFFLNIMLFKNKISKFILISLAVSIKMNVLLFSPALAILLIIEHGLFGAINHIILCAIIQVIFLLIFKVN
jgi:alpha-1,3-mannosyltransferase